MLYKVMVSMGFFGGFDGSFYLEFFFVGLFFVGGLYELVCD